MFQSIVEDIKSQFRTGNMITRLIILNIGIWAVMALIKSFSPSAYVVLLDYTAIPGEPLQLLFRPWTIITHIFIHAGFWHVFWNMMVLYWFGRILGDLIGDRHMLPLYFAGGIIGGLAYFVSYQLMPGYIGAYALGASAAVMALVLAAGRVAPDYIMHLLIIGAVKLKFIVLALLFFDLLGVMGRDNTGGHIAHMAGMAMGWYFISQLGIAGDITARFTGIFGWVTRLFSGRDNRRPRRESPLKVKYRSEKLNKTPQDNTPTTEKVDQILEKIKKSGFESLSAEERDILARASKI